MKNIHLIPTDKPSRLAYDFYEKFYLLSEDTQFFEFQNLVQNRELYITSDEEIKEGDWYMTSDNKILYCYKVYMGLIYANLDYGRNPNGCQKIILTTDQDLISEGIQQIDDEFLEWFVSKANDSGKPIDIVEVRKEKYSERFNNDKSPIGNYETWGNRWVIDIPKEEPKQETLNEAAEDYAEINKFISDRPFEFARDKNAFIAGAEWQAKRMYSEEDMRKAFEWGIAHITFEEWLEEFKKKQ